MALIFRAGPNGEGRVLREGVQPEINRPEITVVASRIGEVALSRPNPEIIDYCRTLATQIGALTCRCSHQVEISSER